MSLGTICNTFFSGLACIIHRDAKGIVSFSFYLALLVPFEKEVEKEASLMYTYCAAQAKEEAEEETLEEEPETPEFSAEAFANAAAKAAADLEAEEAPPKDELR